MNENTKLELLRRIAKAGDGANARLEAEAMGLDRSAAEGLSVSLMTEGLLEMVGLSGAVRLTPAGMGLIKGADAAEAGTDDMPGLLADIAAAGDLGLNQRQATDLAADTACLLAHLGRSRPLEPVVKACLASIVGALQASTAPAAAGLLVRAQAFRGK